MVADHLSLNFRAEIANPNLLVQRIFFAENFLSTQKSGTNLQPCKNFCAREGNQAAVEWNLPYENRIENMGTMFVNFVTQFLDVLCFLCQPKHKLPLVFHSWKEDELECLVYFDLLFFGHLFPRVWGRMLEGAMKNVAGWQEDGFWSL